MHQFVNERERRQLPVLVFRCLLALREDHGRLDGLMTCSSRHHRHIVVSLLISVRIAVFLSVIVSSKWAAVPVVAAVVLLEAALEGAHGVSGSSVSEASLVLSPRCALPIASSCCCSCLVWLLVWELSPWEHH